MRQHARLKYPCMKSMDSLMEALDMAKCPKDGTEVAKPSKEWDVAPKSKKGPKLHVKLYTCPKCGHKWREATKV